MGLLGRGIAHEKTRGGANVLLRRLGTLPARLPLAVLLGRLDAAAASLELLCWGCGNADGGSDENEDCGELHVDGWILGRCDVVVEVFVVKLLV